MEGTKKLGDCRLDIQQFLERDGMVLTIGNDIFDDGNKKIGHLKLKLTFYSNKWGKIQVRIF
jgi:hypothetical protein